MPFEQPVVEQQIQSEAPMSSENIGIEMQQPKPVPTMGTETNLRGEDGARSGGNEMMLIVSDG
ncbi:hypothetical protein BTUL_0257g00130 [Botrytis tulipae]|uniref:Uncharacterized protein n=1 Tax=Botrytis tulipae TaxID=87230 RepID=A0A4Z1EA42_9HELO|nr:hypothetical protein BTUL_0257g00130 [Botrytis tulipae]